MRFHVPTSTDPIDPVLRESDGPLEDWVIRGVAGDAVPVRVGNADDPRVVVLAAHGLTGSRVAPYITGASKQWMRGGITVVSLDLPVHGERRSAVGGFEMAHAPATVVQALGDLRRTTDFVVERVGSLPIVLVGFSMGAMLGTMYAAQDERVSALCLVVAGSNSRKIRVSNTNLPPEALDLLEASDPASYAPDVSPRPVLMLSADRDEVFDRVSAFDLYDRFGHPKELTFFPGTHADWPHPGPVYRAITRFILEAR